jgi:porphobilinogen deaminase
VQRSDPAYPEVTTGRFHNYRAGPPGGQPKPCCQDPGQWQSTAATVQRSLRSLTCPYFPVNDPAKVKSGLDAVILAASGLRRLGLDDAITELLDPALFPPSPGQGALAVQVRAGDRELLEMLNAFGDPDADAAVRAERLLLGELHGGCSVPVGAYATRSGGVLTLSAQVTSLDGQQEVTGTVVGTSPETAGTELAAVLKERGADAILDQIREPARR